MTTFQSNPPFLKNVDTHLREVINIWNIYMNVEACDKV